MKKKIKIGEGEKEFEFVFNFPDILQERDTDKSLNDWFIRLKNYKKTDKNNWTEFPFLPQYKFKNIKIVQNDIVKNTDALEIEFTVLYDEIKKIEI